MAAPMLEGAPVVTVPDDGSPATFTWTNGVIAADLNQARKGASDLIAQQIAGGAINSDSTITVNPDNTFSLHITKSVFFQTITVDATGTLTAATDAAGNSTTAFTMTGTVDSGGLASQSQIVSQLTTWTAAWETQAKKEPLVRSARTLPGE